MTVSRALDALQEDDFAPHLGTPFRLHQPEGEPLELVLTEVKAHPHLPGPAERRHGFSLTFRSAQPRPLPQAIYRLDHDRLGSLELFLVPIGPREGGMGYEAVFN